jgi:hypothetical protein
VKKIFCFRLAAGFFDLLAGFILAYFLRFWVGYFFAARAVITLQIGSPNTYWQGLIPWIIGFFSTYFYSLPLAFFLVFLPEAIWGKSAGKMFLWLTIKDHNGLTPAPQNLWLRFILKTTIFWGTTLALLLGNWPIIILSIISGVLILIFGLPDHFAGTKVVEIRD